jgi:TorA maturation chaperone TorD
VVEYLEGLGMHFPESTVDIADVEKKYHAEVRKEKNEPADA